MDTKKTTVPRGLRNNNPLNIVKGNNWQGETSVPLDSRFESFVSMSYGLRAGFIILRKYITGGGIPAHQCDTIEKIISRWAPASENDTEAYISFVSRRTGINRYERIHFPDRKKMVALVEAMAMYECGQPISVDVIQSAYDMV